MELKSLVTKNVLKNKITKIEESLNEIVKYCRKLNVDKFLTGNILYDLFLGVSAIESSVLGNNVNWNLKMMPAIERCSLHRGFVMRA